MIKAITVGLATGLLFVCAGCESGSTGTAEKATKEVGSFSPAPKGDEAAKSPK
jgi:hypothetical protein